MFTGIVEAKASVRSSNKKGSLFLTIEKPKNWKIKAGDSISMDGVCLTVKKIGSFDFTSELMPETLSKTYFGRQVPKKVNLERSLRVGSRLGGHFILGHVDTVGKIEEVKFSGLSKIDKISFPKQFAKFVAQKGSISVDGVSLTVVDVGANWFTVSLVDYTVKHTTLGEKKKGGLVNLEFDMLAKYLIRLIK